MTYGVEANLVFHRPRLAVCRHVDHDDLGVQFFQHIVAEAHDVDGAGPEVLKEYVRDLHKVSQHFLALVGSEVYGEALFTGVVLHPVGTLASNGRAVATALISIQRLYLDNFCAHTGEHQGATRACLIPSQVQYSQSGQRRVLFGHVYLRPFLSRNGLNPSSTGVGDSLPACAVCSPLYICCQGSPTSSISSSLMP